MVGVSVDFVPGAQTSIGVTLESNRENIPIHDYNEWLKSKERSFSEN